MGNEGNRLAVVGGGAAGLAAAIAAAERAREVGAPLQVTVFERDERVGRSILATGNGRCNFSNEHPRADCYHNADFVGQVYGGLLFSAGPGLSGRKQMTLRDMGDAVHAFFHRHGLVWRQESDGRQYPKTNKASTVVDVLRASARQVGVREACEREVRAIDAPRGEGAHFTLKMSDGVLERADAVIVACGGRALADIDACGLRVLPLRPVLGPLRVSDDFIPLVRELDNIRVKCSVSLVRGAVRPPGFDGQGVVARESGELMFRKYGVSGICVFNLSRFAQPGDWLAIDFMGAADLDAARAFLYGRRKLLAESFGGLTCEDMLRGVLLPRVGEAVLKRAGLKASRPFSKADVAALAEALAAFPLEVAGIGDADLCQVRRGGYDVAAFDPSTLQALDAPGLFAAGEALDVDGPCGGYNLHGAWASGMLAGRSAANRLAGC